MLSPAEEEGKHPKAGFPVSGKSITCIAAYLVGHLNINSIVIYTYKCNTLNKGTGPINRL